jgi:hypothetical protein
VAVSITNNKETDRQTDRETVKTDLFEFRECVRKVLDDHRHEPREESFRGIEQLLSVTHGTAQNAAQHVPAPIRGRLCAIGDRKGQRADVVGHHAVRHVHQSLILRAQLAPIRSGAGDLLNGGEDGLEDVCVVVGVLALQDGCQALKTHARVDVLGGELLQRSVRLKQGERARERKRQTESTTNNDEQQQMQRTSRLNWMKTLFQISITSGRSALTKAPASRPPMRS